MPGNQKYRTPTEILNQTYWKYLVSLEMSSDPKNYFGFTFDEFRSVIIHYWRTQAFVRLPVTASNRVRNTYRIPTEILNQTY